MLEGERMERRDVAVLQLLLLAGHRSAGIAARASRGEAKVQVVMPLLTRCLFLSHVEHYFSLVL
uniref:Predicted protein n=1 Tax=Hordeum vulgare subsp. vulgare TaxID=112509 RepID=F2DPB0_HORVV|nr:predicted protein [Hordeum vulgare subsp. vulgare]